MTSVKTNLFDGILYPTDQSPATLSAFYHALRLALASHAHLRMLHVEGDPDEAGHFPKVRDTITLWENLDRLATEEDLKNLGLGIRKVRIKGSDPLDKLISKAQKYLDHLLVLAPRKRGALQSLFHKSVSATLLQETDCPCLMVAEGTRGFVDKAGRVDLNRILIPVDQTPDARPAIEAAKEMIQLLDVENPAVTLLHVGEQFPLSKGDYPELWTAQVVGGDPAEAICNLAETDETSLLVMVTEGRTTLLDSIRGSVTERVIRSAPCPVLVLHP